MRRLLGSLVLARTSPASAATPNICAPSRDFRTYYGVVSDLVGVLHLQGGDMLGLIDAA